MTVVYTDGACSIKDNRAGGWAWAVHESYYASGYVPDASNQQMELLAALNALRSLGGPVEVVSDSMYLINCFHQKWYKTWIKNNWRTSKKKLVLNRQYWEPLIELYIPRMNEITFTWVKGHSGNKGNDFVDGLAVKARIDKQDDFEFDWDNGTIPFK